MPPPFLFARSRGLRQSEVGKNGQTKTDNSGRFAELRRLRWRKGRGLEAPSVLEQWPQLSAFRAKFCHGAGEKAGCLTVKPPS
jgi:hypothetical protein